MKKSINKVVELWDRIEEIRVGMFTTLHEGDDLHARPMTVIEVDADGFLWFFSSKEDELTSDVSVKPLVNVSFVDVDNNFFVSLSGRAEFIKDRAQYRKLWTPILAPWFSGGVDDPDLLLIRFHIADVMCWSGDDSRMVHSTKLTTPTSYGQQMNSGQPTNSENRGPSQLS